MFLPVIEITEDGSQTLRHPVSGDLYHSSRGAAGEAGHVFVGAGLQTRIFAGLPPGGRIRILEIGFGSGLNCYETVRFTTLHGVDVEYHGLELYPVPQEVWGAMQYASDPLFRSIHEAEWDVLREVTAAFSLKKVEADLVSTAFDTTFDVVYMDAFAPDSQPEMWSEEVFSKLFGCTAPGGMLVTYCSKGDVKRALRSAGYRVERLAGALGKRHMLRAMRD